MASTPVSTTFIIVEAGSPTSNQAHFKETFPNRPVTFMSIVLLVASIMIPLFQVTTLFPGKVGPLYYWNFFVQSI